MGVGQNQVIDGQLRLLHFGMQYFLSLPFPVPLHHARQTVDDYVEKAADDQTQQRSNENKGQHMAGHIFDEIHVSDNGAQLEDWQVHGDDQTSDQNTENGHDHGFKQGSQVIHLVVHLCLVVIRHFLKHAVQVTRLLANSRHLNCQGWEDVGGTHGKVELSTGRNVTLDVIDSVVEHHVTCSTRHRIQSLNQRYTSGKGRGQCPRITCNRSFIDNLAYDRSFEKGAVLSV